MNAPLTTELQAEAITFKLNGDDIVGYSNETIIETAKRNGVEIPHLCYKPGYRPDGNCRACMVEIKGERVLAPSCCRYPKAGMEVTSNNERSLNAQKMILELLLSDMPEKDYTLDSELDQWAKKLDMGKPRFAPRPSVKSDISHPAMSVNLDACIQCTRCVRACREEQVNDVIGYAFRGDHSKIVFDLDDPMGESTCVACGECVQACPTGALMPAREVALSKPDKTVDSLCPYCGVGCQLTYNIKDNKILYVEGRDGPANHNRLCVKGRYGFDYVHHKHRLTKPLIRKPGRPKPGHELPSPEEAASWFREATWQEALDLAAGNLKNIRDRDGANALAGFGSAKGSNEEAYLIPKIDSYWFRNQQRRSLHALMSRVIGNGAARRHRLRRGIESSFGCDEGRSHFSNRRKSDCQSSCRCDLDKECREEWRQVDYRRPASQQLIALCLAYACSSKPTPTSRCSTR